MDNQFQRTNVLYNLLTKAAKNCTNRLEALRRAEASGDEDLLEIVRESVVQTYEVTIELAWKTARAYALKIEPQGRVSGSNTAIKLAYSTGVIRSEKIARDLLEAIQHRNMSSHEYMLTEGMQEYIESIGKCFMPAILAFIKGLEEE